MSDLLLSLPHYHRHIAIYVVLIINTIVGHMCHNNNNTCICWPQTGCTARKMALSIISQDRQTQLFAANAMATTIIID